MNITLRQLQAFNAVAGHLSVTEAAKQLYLTQPAVSMQIKQLEEVWGVKLFKKQGRQLLLSEIGQQLILYSERVTGALNQAKTCIAEHQGQQQQRLSIVVATTISHFAAVTIAAFTQLHPSCQIKLEVVNRQSVLDKLQQQKCDLALMGQPPLDQALQAQPFMHNPLVIIAPTTHPLAQHPIKQGSLSLGKVLAEPFIMREAESGTRQTFEKQLAIYGHQLTNSMEMNSNEAIKQSVEAGIGLGVVSIHTIADELANKRLAILDVEHFPIRRTWFAVRRKESYLAEVGEAFLEFVLQRGDL